MATSTNVPQSVGQSKLAVVPFPAPQAVTQLELTALLSLRGRLHQIEQQVRDGLALRYNAAQRLFNGGGE